MSAKNKFVVLGAACASLAMVVFAQDDLDNLLEELGADSSLVRKIQEHNLRIAKEAGSPSEESKKDPLRQLEQLKKEYRRSVRK